MNPATSDTTSTVAESGTLRRLASSDKQPPGAIQMAIGAASWWQKLPAPPMVLTGLLAAFALFPPVSGNPRLVASFLGIAGVLFIWELILWGIAKQRGRVFRIEYTPVKSHWVQACVQFSIMLYWGWFWPDVFPELPLIFGQVVFLYALDAMLSWSRGRTWRLGYGPLPIVVSTNLLLWFRHDWYYMQFLMLATGALAKQFITWERDGKRTHIFNPSAFGQSVFAVALIATATTRDFTVGREIAASFDTPHMLVVIFLGGLVVQYLFHVTLMTVAATATLALLNVIYTKITGVYVFVNISIAAPIFLGLHLLVTDPATSPRTNIGKVLYGVFYALGYAALFRLFDIYEVPLFWDKLLPVPILNLCVPLIDRVIRSGFIGRVNLAWETALKPKSLNLIHMGCWAALFTTMWMTRFIDAPHPGNSIPFWKKAYAEGKAHSGHSLVLAAGNQAEGGGSGAAFNELGLICMEGKIVRQSNAAAAKYFARASELRDESGSVNVAIQYLFLRERRSDEDIARALTLLEQDCEAGGSGRSCYLIGFAYETGRGRPLDLMRAMQFYQRSGIENLYGAKGLARIGLSGVMPLFDVRAVVERLMQSAREDDAESAWYIAYMYHTGIWLRQDEEQARTWMQQACSLGSQQACEAMKMPAIPPYSNPVINVPGWATAFPMP